MSQQPLLLKSTIDKTMYIITEQNSTLITEYMFAIYTYIVCF